jgi:hypothetical protein
MPPVRSYVVPVVLRDDYQIGYERSDGYTFGHITVTRWSPSIARDIGADIQAAHELHRDAIYALGLPGDAKQARFLELYGFHPCGTVRNENGVTVPIYERTLDGQPIRWWSNHPNDPL